MSELLKVNACVYSRKGDEREYNKDDFYMNGKFLSEHHLDNMQASIENRGSEFVFAVADHMEFSDDEKRANFSILREMGRFHEKITVHEGDLAFKTKELNSRVAETGKYLNSFLDMNSVPETDQARQMGFSGLLLSEGNAVGATYGTGHIYLCRGGIFKHMTVDRAKPKRLADLGIISDEEAESFQEKFDSADEDDSKQVSMSEPVELLEGDKFLLISDGIYNALGEEYLEDILSMRSDSTYIAYRILNEASKKDPIDDMTAMVISIERVSSTSSVVKKAAARPKPAALKSTPPPTYKYHKKSNYKKYENIIYYLAVFFTAVLIILILYFVIKNIMNSLNEPDNNSPTPIVSITGTVSPTPEITEAVTPTPEVTPQPTEAPHEVREHRVKQGDTLSKIARQYYGEDYVYVEKLGKYNGIPDPYNNIVIDQVLKIPPVDVLLKIK
ncbi:MAG: LysM peptidoglycan-binding domain-containing protein [Ruminiclostridium sp.]|nr:LysM peptidoglycan-binding domain-containing protein [Ruminiclostridium sp.]